MAILEKFGTIYLDGVPVPPGTVLTKCDPNNPPKIELGDTVPGMEIGWVFVDDRLIADDNILLNVSWDILSASGLAMGKDIQIDGDACRVRCLQEAENGGSDWEDLLNRAVDDYIIHWSGTYSMGTSVLSPHSKQAIIWGCADKDTVEMADSSYQHIGFGWRPVLEQKSLMELPEQELLFRTVLLFGEDGTIFSGVVAEVSQYDILLEDPSILENIFWQPVRGKYYKKQDDGLIFDMESVIELLPCAGVSVPLPF